MTKYPIEVITPVEPVHTQNGEALAGRGGSVWAKSISSKTNRNRPVAAACPPSS